MYVRECSSVWFVAPFFPSVVFLAFFASGLSHSLLQACSARPMRTASHASAFLQSKAKQSKTNDREKLMQTKINLLSKVILDCICKRMQFSLLFLSPCFFLPCGCRHKINSCKLETAKKKQNNKYLEKQRKKTIPVCCYKISV